MNNYISFEDCTYLSQIRRLRNLAYNALEVYPLKKYDLKFIQHGENTTLFMPREITAIDLWKLSKDETSIDEVGNKHQTHMGRFG